MQRNLYRITQKRNTMNLTESYLQNNGYDYFGNAAEDTLVFFVRDEDAPYVDADYDEDENLINGLNNSLKGASGTLLTKDDNLNIDDIAGSVSVMTPIDEKQTEVRKTDFKI